MGLDMNYEAEVFVDTENLSREDWLACRRKGIGGSDAAAIMGMSPFCTKRDLYYDKCGIQAVMDIWWNKGQYSVPYKYIGCKVDVKFNSHLVFIYYTEQR